MSCFGDQMGRKEQKKRKRKVVDRYSGRERRIGKQGENEGTEVAGWTFGKA